MKRVMMVLVGAALFAAPAFANDDVAVLTKYGLIGSKWAVDCSKPMSASNYYLSYRVGPSGSPLQILKSTKLDQARELRNVQAITAGWFLYTLIDENGEPIDILTKVEGNRAKSWWSIGQGGKAYIVNGKGDNWDPPWFERCK